MLLTVPLAIGLFILAVVAGGLYYREVVRNRTRRIIPPMVGVSPGNRPIDRPETVPVWTAPQAVATVPVWTAPQAVPHVRVEPQETLAAAEAEARLIMEVATNAARAILEQAEATKAQAEGELAAARAKEAEELAATRGRLDIVRRQCIEELAGLETRKRELAGECRQMHELHDMLKADLALIEERVRASLSTESQSRRGAAG